jgi:hypothetical protein
VWKASHRFPHSYNTSGKSVKRFAGWGNEWTTYNFPSIKSLLNTMEWQLTSTTNWHFHFGIGLILKPVIRHRGYVYHWNLALGDAYLYLRYQPWWQKKSRKYTLQIETHTDHLVKFQRLLDALSSHTQKLYFSRCELAYDFPYPMSNVFIASNTGRNMNVYEWTRYFGRKDESKAHAFCRNYDKKEERKWGNARGWNWFIDPMRKYLWEHHPVSAEVQWLLHL